MALIGQEILSYRNYEIPQGIEQMPQDELKRKIERIKIKLEDAGLGNGAEIMREYNEVSERDVFLSKELEDLTKSIEALQNLIVELKEKIDIEFKEGVKKINVEFQEFFSLMFGGGTGALSIVTPEKRKGKKKGDDELDEEDVAEGLAAGYRDQCVLAAQKGQRTPGALWRRAVAHFYRDTLRDVSGESTTIPRAR